VQKGFGDYCLTKKRGGTLGAQGLATQLNFLPYNKIWSPMFKKLIHDQNFQLWQRGINYTQLFATIKSADNQTQLPPTLVGTN
jgi:hypothetical protein